MLQKFNFFECLNIKENKPTNKLSFHYIISHFKSNYKFANIIEIFPHKIPVLYVCNSSAKPLTIYVMSKSKMLHKLFLKTTSSGGFLINDTMMHLAGLTIYNYCRNCRFMCCDVLLTKCTVIKCTT